MKTGFIFILLIVISFSQQNFKRIAQTSNAIPISSLAEFDTQISTKTWLVVLIFNDSLVSSSFKSHFDDCSLTQTAITFAVIDAMIVLDITERYPSLSEFPTTLLFKASTQEDLVEGDEQTLFDIRVATVYGV